MRLRLQIKVARDARSNVLKGSGEVGAAVHGSLSSISTRGQCYSTVEVPGTGLPWLVRILIVLLGAAAGYLLASNILVKVDPPTQQQEVLFFSTLAAVTLAAIAAKVVWPRP